MEIMKVVSCEPGQMAVSPEQYNACTFEIIDKWEPDKRAKTCDTMFYLRDGTGAYVWDCDQWIFLPFNGLAVDLTTFARKPDDVNILDSEVKKELEKIIDDD